MVKRNKHIRVRLLMIVSMLLLTGFVGYWLVDQYGDQKALLYKNMTNELVLVQDEVQDSVILKALQPMIMDSLNIELRQGQSSKVEILSDSLAYQVDYQFFHKGEGELDEEIHIVDRDRKDFFLKGVEVVMRIASDSTSDHEILHNRFFAKEDSQQVLLGFSKRVEEFTGHNFDVVWTVDTLQNSMTQKTGQFLITTKEFPENQFVKVDRVFSYIIGQMIPQILFAVFLLILSGSAFLITYRSLRRQIELNTIRNEFVSNISHELKTPVSTVKVALEAIQNYQDNQDGITQKEYLSMAQSELDRLEHLTHKVLVHSKLESNQFVEDFEEVDLVELCNKLETRFRARIESAGSTMTCQFSKDMITIEADPDYLDGVLTNLVDNALKYAGPAAEIDLIAKHEEKQIRLTVSDRGPGIPREYKSRIFDKFFRIPTDNTHNIKGHGLGLSFARQVMEQHGGSITVKNRAGGGAVFELIFPCKSES